MKLTSLVGGTQYQSLHVCLISYLTTRQSSTASLPALPGVWLAPTDSSSQGLETWTQPGWSDMSVLSNFSKCRVSPSAGLLWGLWSSSMESWFLKSLYLPISCTAPGAMMLFHRWRRFHPGKCPFGNGRKCQFSIVVVSFHWSAQFWLQEGRMKRYIWLPLLSRSSQLKKRPDYIIGANKCFMNVMN